MSELLEQAVAAVERAQAAGAQEAWGNAGRSRGVSFSVRDGQLETVSESTTQSLSLKIWVDGRYSSHITTDLRPDAVTRFAREAVEMTRLLQPDPHRQITDAALFADRAAVDLDLVDQGIGEMDRSQREALCLAQNERLMGVDGVVSATSSCEDRQAESAAVSSNGFEGHQQWTAMWLGSAITMRADTQLMEASMWGGGVHRSQAPTPQAIAAEVLHRARTRLGAVKGPSRRGMMIVDPYQASRLLSRLLQPATGSAVQQGRSFWAGKEGQPLISEKLVVTDEPLLPREEGSRLFDGEGIAAKPMPILANGALQNLYIDTYYGRKLGRTPTTTFPSNRVIQPGQRNLMEIISDMDEAIYVTSWLGGNSDSTTGDFSLGMRGHLIINGEIGPSVSEMNVTGNLLELFANLVEVGNDPWPYGRMKTPTLVFDGVDFSGV